MYETRTKLTWSSDTSIPTEIEWMIVVSVLNNILISPYMEDHWASGENVYWTVYSFNSILIWSVHYSLIIIFKSNSMNDWHISYEWHNCIRMGGVTFSNWWVSLLPSIYIEYDITILFAWWTDISIHIEVEWMTVVFILNDIFVTV